MLVLERGALALDEEVFDVGSNFEWVAIGDDDVGDFAGFDGAHLIGYAKNLGGIDGDGFEGFVVGEAVGDGVGGLLAEAAGEGIVKAAEGKFYSGGGQFGRLREK